MREPKESPWKLSEPLSFRKWLKKTMTPMGYDKALKRKERLAIAYFFASLFGLNLCAREIWNSRKDAPSVEAEHPGLQQYLSVTPEENVPDRKAYILSYENFKFKKMEVIDVNEFEKRRREGSDEGSDK